MKKKDFLVLKDILPRDICQKVEKKMREKEILNYFSDNLENTLKQHVKPIYIRGTQIFVVVDNPIWGQEFMLYKDLFLKRINTRFKEKFSNIGYRFDPRYFTKEVKQGDPYKELNEEEKIKVDHDTDRIEDNDLKDKLKSILSLIIKEEKK